MPRRNEPDEEDMMLRCPRCSGTGTVYQIDLDAEAECPLCEGSGRVSQYVHHRYVHGVSWSPPTPPG